MSLPRIVTSKWPAQSCVMLAWAVVLMSPARSFACSCLEQSLAGCASGADFILTGKVVAVVGSGPRPANPPEDMDLVYCSSDMVLYTIVVDQVWKGAWADTVRVYSAADSGSCGCEFVVSDRYLVYGDWLDGSGGTNSYWAVEPEYPVRVTDRCRGTKRLDKARLDLEYLRRRAAAAPGEPATETESLLQEAGCDKCLSLDELATALAVARGVYDAEVAHAVCRPSDDGLLRINVYYVDEIDGTFVTERSLLLTDLSPDQLESQYPLYCKQPIEGWYVHKEPLLVREKRLFHVDDRTIVVKLDGGVTYEEAQGVLAAIKAGDVTTESGAPTLRAFDVSTVRRIERDRSGREGYTVWYDVSGDPWRIPSRGWHMMKTGEGLVVDGECRASP